MGSFVSGSCPALCPSPVLGHNFTAFHPVLSRTQETVLGRIHATRHHLVIPLTIVGFDQDAFCFCTRKGCLQEDPEGVARQRFPFFLGLSRARCEGQFLVSRVFSLVHWCSISIPVISRISQQNVNSHISSSFPSWGCHFSPISHFYS